MIENAPFIILAGGQSRRMGQDKAEILIDGRAMIDLVIERVSQQHSTIKISGSKTYQTDLSQIPDREDGPQGPVAGIYAAYKWCESQKDIIGFYTVPVDAPALPVDLCERLWSAEQSQYAVGPKRTHPAFAWWRLHDLRLSFAALDTDSSISLHKLAETACSVPVKWNSENPFFNINTPNDVQEYLTFL